MLLEVFYVQIKSYCIEMLVRIIATGMGCCLTCNDGSSPMLLDSDASAANGRTWKQQLKAPVLNCSGFEMLLEILLVTATPSQCIQVHLQQTAVILECSLKSHALSIACVCSYTYVLFSQVPLGLKCYCCNKHILMSSPTIYYNEHRQLYFHVDTE